MSAPVCREPDSHLWAVVHGDQLREGQPCMCGKRKWSAQAALDALRDRLAAAERHHAALLDWAERAAEAIERAEYWAGKQVIPSERSPQRDEWRDLLAAWAEMRERPS